MHQFEWSIYINRPPHEVFAFVSDPAQNARWSRAVKSARWDSEGPIGIGSIIRTVSEFQGREVDGLAEITSWDPPHQYTQRSIGGDIPYEVTVRFRPKDGGTLMTQSARAELDEFFGSSQDRFVKEMQEQFNSDLTALKLLLEGA